MYDNNEMSLYKKLNFKLVADLGFIGLFVLISILLNIVVKNNLTIIICIIGFMIVYIFSQIAVHRWLFLSFGKTLQKDYEITQETIMDMLDTNSKQRQIISAYSKITDTLKTFCYKLQNFSNSSKNFNSKIIEKTEKTNSYADESSRTLENSIAKFNVLNDRIHVIAKLIVELNEQIEQISSTISVIENIAEQTNMLALNTAVEAARAGEHGKGFAVVANEIRKLADESKQATHKINYMINNVQQVANSTVLATEQGANEIEIAAQLVNTLKANSENFKECIKDIQLNIDNISESFNLQDSLPKEIEDLIVDFEKNTILSTEMLDKTIESINILNDVSCSFNQALLDTKKA